QSGRMREGEEHLAATVRHFEAEGLDSTPIREAWRAARAQAPSRSPRLRAEPSSPAVAPKSTPCEIIAPVSSRASVAVMPFGDRIVASIASEIETAERNRAILKPPSSLDAWEAHHRGLWHMYRFNQADNDRARHFFEMAVRLDPTFARAHAGLSFTHWQNAFQ